MDAYDRKARLYPAALVFAPMTVLVLTLFGTPAWWSGFVAFVTAGGLHFALIQVVRDRGHRKEQALWDSWGGPPTTRMLRWSESGNPVLQQRRHDEVAAIAGHPLPTRAEEAADATNADHHYEAAVSVLRDRTRKKDFALVEAQNTNYGYRRNTYGCKPFGIAVALATGAGQVTVAILALKDVLDVPASLMFVGAGASLVWLLFWAFVVTPSFVRRAAERYAEALLAAAGTLGEPEPPLIGRL